MPPAKSWTPSSESPDTGEGTRDAPHGYRPWPNSGRDEPASRFRIRRPSIAESMAEKLASRQAAVCAAGEAGQILRRFSKLGFRVVEDVAEADVIVVGDPKSRIPARRLQRGQLIVLDSTAVRGKSRDEIVRGLRKSGKSLLLAYYPIPRDVDDDNRPAVAALYAALNPA